MRLRNIVTTMGAVLAAGALALAPTAAPTAAHASSPIASSVLDGGLASVTTTGSFKSGTVTMDVYGSPMTLNCSGGSAGGTISAGSPAPNPFLSFSTLTLICDSFLSGGTFNLSLTCPVTLRYNVAPVSPVSKVTTGKTDLIHSTLDAGTILNPCVKVTVVTAGIPCNVPIYGTTPATWDENKKGAFNNESELTLTGSGLTIYSTSIGCLGAISAGQTITMNNIKFNIFNHGLNFLP